MVAGVAFLDLFYNGLFHPVAEYRRISEQDSPSNLTLFYGLIFVILISAMAPVVHTIWKAGDVSGLVFAVPYKAVTGLAIWLFMASIVSTLSYAFTGQARFRTLLALSALSTLPWVLMGPLSLLKIGLGDLGNFVGVAAGLILWLWSVFLFALSIGVTYRLSLEKVLIILVMPFLFSTVAFAWIVGFFVQVSKLLP